MDSTARELEFQPVEEQVHTKRETISVGKSFVIGLQHVLAMDIFIPPIILAGLLSFSVADTALLIQMTFLACGVATVIQAGFAMKLPVMQGPSFVPLSALAAIGTTSGLGAMVGSLMPGALLIAVLGYPLKLFSKVVGKFIPKLVAGTVIIVVGVALMPSAISSIYTAPGSFGSNIAVASVTASVLVLCMYFGEKFTNLKFIKLTSVILSLVIGTVMASFFGMVDFSAVAEAGWFALPSIFAFGTPVFELEAIITMVIIYFIIMIETTGTWFTVSNVTDEKLDTNRLNGGAAGEGLGCFAGSLFGGTPVTGYSSNAGVVAITGVKSRNPVIAGGIILIALGMMPKLMNIIASIPAAVISSVFAIVCVVIMMNGFRVVKDIQFTERNMLLVGLPIMLTLFTVFLPAEVLNEMPNILNYIFSSGLAVGALAAVILNMLLPE
ncbi:nucleobase:cation symporter-2 family protein [Virgibacillus ainsalahensis]